jgi:hypothetical protein
MESSAGKMKINERAQEEKGKDYVHVREEMIKQKNS